LSKNTGAHAPVLLPADAALGSAESKASANVDNRILCLRMTISFRKGQQTGWPCNPQPEDSMPARKRGDAALLAIDRARRKPARGTGNAACSSHALRPPAMLISR